MLETNRAFDSDGKSVPLHSNVSENEASDLYHCTREISPDVSIEIGFCQGVSALAILKAVADSGGNGKHHIIDPFQHHYGDTGLEMVRRAGLGQHMQFHRLFTEEVVPAFPVIDFAFIDSSHLFDLTVCEFVLVDKKMRIGGVVGFHDMWMPSQQAFIRYVLANRSYRVFQPARRAASPAARRASFLKRTLRRGLGAVPKAKQIFSSSFLQPWHELQLGNLVFLQKTAADSRDWRFHVPF